MRFITQKTMRTKTGETAATSVPVPSKADEDDEPAAIVAVDLQPMAPIEGVHCMQGDITSQETAKAIIAHFQGQRAELVVCDGAPDVTGLHDVDEYLQGQLLLSAMLIATHVLKPGSTFVAKIFRGGHSGTQFLYDQLNLLFVRVSIAKPSSSRNSSMEAFVVCQNFRGGRYLNLPLDTGRGFAGVEGLAKPMEGLSLRKKEDDIEEAVMKSTIVPFIACGDLSGWKPASFASNGAEPPVLDADKSYSVDSPGVKAETGDMPTSNYIAPIAPPIAPPYQASIERHKEERRQKAQS